MCGHQECDSERRVRSYTVMFAYCHEHRCTVSCASHLCRASLSTPMRVHMTHLPVFPYFSPAPHCPCVQVSTGTVTKLAHALQALLDAPATALASMGEGVVLQGCRALVTLTVHADGLRACLATVSGHESLHGPLRRVAGAGAGVPLVVQVALAVLAAFPSSLKAAKYGCWLLAALSEGVLGDGLSLTTTVLTEPTVGAVSRRGGAAVGAGSSTTGSSGGSGSSSNTTSSTSSGSGSGGSTAARWKWQDRECWRAAGVPAAMEAVVKAAEGDVSAGGVSSKRAAKALAFATQIAGSVVARPPGGQFGV